MEAVCSSDMLVMTYQARVWCQNLDEYEWVVDQRHTETNFFVLRISQNKCLVTQNMVIVLYKHA